MEHKFWLDRWEQGDIGFHRDAVHPALEKHWPELGLAARSRVLVPLCGATPDMAWLAAQGHEVIGVELSQLALERFLKEHRVRHITMDEPGFRTYLGGRYQLWCGDFFAIPDDIFASADAVYDRASLVALPPDMRRRYAAQLSERIRPAARMLLVSLDYDATQMNGPPFAVPDDEVATLFAEHFDISRMSNLDVLADNEGLRKRGLTALRESVFSLTRKATS